MAELKNVSNPEEMDEALTKLGEGQSAEIGKWISKHGRQHLLSEVSCFRRLSVSDLAREHKKKPWMLRAFPSGKLVYEFDIDDNDWQSFVEEVEHCIIYLRSLQENGQKNIGPVPYDKALSEGNRMLERQKMEEKFGEGPSDKVKLHAYPNGYTWWELRTPKALRNESIHMGHCVGNAGMGYISKIENGSARILSLRDSKNVPHVTIELESSGYLRQCKGNSNSKIADKYKGAVVGFLRSLINERKITSVNTLDMGMSDISDTDLGVRFGEAGGIER